MNNKKFQKPTALKKVKVPGIKLHNNTGICIFMQIPIS